VLLTGTFHKDYGAELKYKLWTRETWYLGFDLGATHFFDSYFGEGNRTSPDRQVKIQNYKYYFNPSIGFRFDPELSLILGTELRHRYETAVDGVVGAKLIGNEFTPVATAALVYDTRDNVSDSRSGRFLQTRMDFGPGAMSTRRGAENFLKTLIELRQFYSPVELLVLGFQIQGGFSLGEPGYLYRFNLGGSSDMRGYQANRLRGRHFYEGQAEARVSILRWLSVVGFAGAGDTADVRLSDFGRVKITKGGGLRIGVPPDFVAKARFDFGIAPDEKHFYLSFNEAF
jgi:outer membrane protein assembly factor BamA